MKRISRRNFLDLVAAGAASIPFLRGLPGSLMAGLRDRGLPAHTLAEAASVGAAPLDVVARGVEASAQAPQAALLGTQRIGQLTGTTDSTHWPTLVDAQGWPLLTDTGRWGVIGTDLGANTEHTDGRLYFFFGDVATKQGSGNPLNSDLVAWTDDTKVLRHGGHLAQGYNFVLPHDVREDGHSQMNWRFCGKCSGLFFDGYPDKGACPKDGNGHEAIGDNFVLPYDVSEDGHHQPNWRFCGKCFGLFFDGYPKKGTCPKDGNDHSSIGDHFVLPHDSPESANAQASWRFCSNCYGLFFDGDAAKGVCAGAQGGGVHVHGVLKQPGGEFAPYEGDPPIGMTLSDETPNGAFSYGGTAYVFAGFNDRKLYGAPGEPLRPGDPAPGCYLTSTTRPDVPGRYHKEFHFSPRIGWCPRDESRDRFENHEPMGLTFFLSHDLPESPTRSGNWLFCRKCAAMFWGDDSATNHCFAGGNHDAVGLVFTLEHDIPEDVQHQAKWDRCSKCSSVFFNGYPTTGLCPAGGTHQAAGANVVLSHTSFTDDAHNQVNWRFCGKCSGLFYDGYQDKGTCPKDHAGHSAIGFVFVLPHDIGEDGHNQVNWRFCDKCSGLFYDGYPKKGTCPKDNAGHHASGDNFALPHEVSEDGQHQRNWRFCNKCSILFSDGSADKGVCPQDGHGHTSAGINFGLAHNPGDDALTQGGWRFCAKCNGLVYTRQEDRFSWVAPVVVTNGDHAHLPPTSWQDGLVMLGFSYSATPGIRLAWAPLKDGAAPLAQDIQYYTGASDQPWSQYEEQAVVLLPHTNSYTHLSAAWLEGPQRWILLYSNAYDNVNNPDQDPSIYRRPIVARIGTTLLDWSEEIAIFDPVREQAYGTYMHARTRDRLNPDLPPAQDPSKPEHDGWAYGAFLLKRYTEWDASSRELTIYYLMSPSSPYQVQLMSSRLHID